MSWRKGMNAEFLRGNFPPISFAFYSDFINRITYRTYKGKPSLDMIFAVKNVKEWHKTNYEMNRKHYPITARLIRTSAVVSFFQQYGARIHFNHYQTQEGGMVRYGVIGYDMLQSDLKHWESLVASSFMHRPIKILISDNGQEIENNQLQNYRSAIALSSLLTQNNDTELNFYKNIVKIPHYSNKWFKLLEKENSWEIVTANIDKFRDIYNPIIEEYFANSIQIENGIFQKIGDRKELFMELNDNILQNLKKIHLMPYNSKHFQKNLLDLGGRGKIIEEVLRCPENKQNSYIRHSLEKILITHRNSRIFAFLMGYTFFIVFELLKWTIKLIIILFFVKKKKKKIIQKGESRIAEKQTNEQFVYTIPKFNTVKLKY